MELLPHLLEHAFEDTIYLVPFLLATYILLELLEHKAGNKAAALVRKAGIAGPFVGSLLGAVPQCGFSAAGSALYASRAITPVSYTHLIQVFTLSFLAPSYFWRFLEKS